MKQQRKLGLLVVLASSLALLLGPPAWADQETVREISNALGQIGRILDEKHQADREGREVRIDTQEIYDNNREFYRQQDERMGRTPIPSYENYNSYGVPNNPRNVNTRPKVDASQFPRPSRRSHQGQSSRYGYLDPTPAQRTRHQRLLDAIESQNQTMGGSDRRTQPTPVDRPHYRSSANQHRYDQTTTQQPAGYPTPSSNTESSGSANSTRDGYPPVTRSPRCVKWSEPVADHGGGVFGTGAAQKCLKTEF